MAEKKPAQLMSIKDGNEEKLHIRTTSSVVSLDRTNPKLPENIYDIQALANALGKLAFLDDTVDPPEPEPEPPLPCKNLTAVATHSAIQLTWEDPNDDTWASTRIVRKTGGYPTSETDGTIVTTTYTKNQYQSSPFVDDGLSSGVTYYYRAFSCSSKGIFNTEDQVTASATIKTSTNKIMTVRIDLSNSNPETCGSYMDDAIGMRSGKGSRAIKAWQKIIGYRPCMFKDGKVVGYLNPENYGEYEDGSFADIISGLEGDVMIEFPRRGIKYSKANGILRISLTENPHEEGFQYDAFTRNTDDVDAFYLAAYPGRYDSYGKLRSLSSVRPNCGSLTKSEMRECAHKNGEGYELMTWFQYSYILSIYCLQFCGRLNSQVEVGVGYLSEEENAHYTGDGDMRGLIFGKSDASYNVKLFGLEGLWGWVAEHIDGLSGIMGTNNVFYIFTANYNFNDTHSGASYKRHDAERIGCNWTDGWYCDPVAKDELAMYPILRTLSHEGSTSTYFCDHVELSTSSWDSTLIGRSQLQTDAEGSYGLFSFYNASSDLVGTKYGCRLSYYK